MSAVTDRRDLAQKIFLRNFLIEDFDMAHLKEDVGHYVHLCYEVADIYIATEEDMDRKIKGILGKNKPLTGDDDNGKTSL